MPEGVTGTRLRDDWRPVAYGMDLLINRFGGLDILEAPGLRRLYRLSLAFELNVSGRLRARRIVGLQIEVPVGGQGIGTLRGARRPGLCVTLPTRRFLECFSQS
jgi:hypothetical protein